MQSLPKRLLSVLVKRMMPGLQVLLDGFGLVGFRV